MKTILVPTDFSASAENAARYAMQLALAIQANVKLCHAYRVPAEPAYAEQSSWPLYEALTLEDNCNKQLALLAAKLMKEEWATGTSGARGLQMTYTSAAGSPFSVVNDLASDKQTLLSVMGMNGFGAICL
jgi:nucleotide-binding universal stress UspA family protein